MEVTVVDKPQVLLLGLGFFGDPFATAGGWSEENEIGRLWKRFLAYLAGHGSQLRHLASQAVSYEVHVEQPETRQTGEYEVFVGVEVTGLESVPVELSVKVLPASTYAAFTLRGEEIVSDWSQRIYRQWMGEAGYESAHDYSVQCYDDRFKGLDKIAESVLEVWVPVRRRAG